MATDALEQIPTPSLVRLSQELTSGGLSHGVTDVGLRASSPEIPGESRAELIALAAAGWTPAQLSFLLRQIGRAREANARSSYLIDLVISGPPVASIPTRHTAATYRSLIEEAEQEILLASYAVFNGRELFAPLAQRMESAPHLKVTAFLDIPRKQGDTTLAPQTVARYRADFFQHQWPDGRPAPEIYYFKRSLEVDWQDRASMHAKVVVIDRRKALVTSANLTEAAQKKNIEVGVLAEGKVAAGRLSEYFSALVEAGEFAKL